MKNRKRGRYYINCVQNVFGGIRQTGIVVCTIKLFTRQQIRHTKFLARCPSDAIELILFRYSCLHLIKLGQGAHGYYLRPELRSLFTDAVRQGPVVLLITFVSISTSISTEIESNIPSSEYENIVGSKKDLTWGNDLFGVYCGVG